jgi:hypothetical protein
MAGGHMQNFREHCCDSGLVHPAWSTAASNSAPAATAAGSKPEV